MTDRPLSAFVAILCGLLGVATLQAAPPVIHSSSPPTQFRTEGHTPFFRVHATGATSYQWKKNGVPIPNATQPEYTGPYATPADAGVYTCTVSNGIESVTCDPVTVIVLGLPRPGQIVTNRGAEVVMSTKIYPASEIPNITFEWAYDDATSYEFADFGTVTGVDSPTLKISDIQAAATRAFSCRLKHQGVFGRTLPQWVAVRQTPEVEQLADQELTVGGLLILELNVLHDPRKITVTNLPPGITFDPIAAFSGNQPQRLIAGRPIKAGNYKVAVRATNVVGASLMTFFIKVNPLPEAMKGSFEGIISRSVMNGKLGGKVSLTTTASGAGSAKVTLGTSVYRFVSKLEVENTGVGGAMEFMRERPGLSDLHMIIGFGSFGRISSGTIRDVNGSADLDLHRIEGAAGSYRGSYNAAYEQPDIMGYAQAPQGWGYAKVMVSPTGMATFANVLADGTTYTQSARLIVPADGPAILYLHALMPGKRGSIVGKATIEGSRLTGGLGWIRTARPLGYRRYFTPFELPNIRLEGARWTPPGKTDVPSGYAPGVANAQFLLRNADPAEGELLTQDFTLAPGKQLQSPLTMSAKAPSGIVLKVESNTGLFYGSVRLNDVPGSSEGGITSRTGEFKGLMIPGANGEGRGFILLPAIPDDFYFPGATFATSPMLSLPVVLQPKSLPPPGN